jgi:uncharacterized repeat protein (TIGR03803 family)
MQASNGYLYGSTQYGGDNFFPSGVVFSYDPVLHNYNSMYIYYCTTGQYPYGDFLQASNGSMYILISNGWGSCTAASGTIMGTDLALSGASNQLLFTGANGAYPYGKLIEPKPGKFYGLTSDGGNNQGGVLFTYQPWASADVVKHHFSTIDGKMPYGNLTMASDGKLYGLTSAGGAHGDGVIFSFDTLSNAYTDLYDFDTVNGASPYGSLFEASNGKLYGMTNLGGLNGKGVIFNYDPSTSTFTKMRDLASSDGANPRYSNFIEVGGPVSVPTITSGEKTFNVFPNPANDNCIITYKAESSNANFNIINMLGEIVFTGQLKDLSTTIECKSFEAGIYTIHIQDAGKTFSKRLAIEK